MSKETFKLFARNHPELAKYSIAVTSKIPGVEIESVASTLQQVSFPYK